MILLPVSAGEVKAKVADAWETVKAYSFQQKDDFERELQTSSRRHFASNSTTSAGEWQRQWVGIVFGRACR